MFTAKPVKYFIYFLLTAGILLSGSLVSCDSDPKNSDAGSPQFQTPYSPMQIADIIIASQSDIPALIPLTPEDDYFPEYLSNIYNINTDAVKDGVIYYADGMIASEIAVLLLSEDADVNQIINSLTQYRLQRTDAFTGYAPDQAAILKSGAVAAKGNYVALLICADAQTAGYDFQMCFSQNPPALPSPATSAEETSPPDISPATEASETAEPETTESLAADAYDPSSIKTAWNSGDSSSLTPKNLSVYNACKDTVSSAITDNMDDFSKELAIHDWITAWAGYDMEAENNSPYANPDPDNDNPYGLLIHKKAICLGYSATFQLFMDLLGIECITVKGFSGSDDHAWNMVKIDGNWYCVDVTWDDPVDTQHPNRPTNFSYSTTHTYFNVTSDFLRQTGHIWDAAGAPEAITPYPRPSASDSANTPRQNNPVQNQNTDDALIQGV